VIHGRIKGLFSTPLLVDVFLIIISWFWHLNGSSAFDFVDEIILIHDGFVALVARFGTGFASLEMSDKARNRDVEETVFTILGFEVANFIVLLELTRWEGLLAMGALLLLVILLLMLISKVNIVHFSAVVTLLNVSTAVAEVGGHFGLREIL
jgi:hypothetical protein